MKAAEIRLSLHRPLQHRDPHMAPTITAAMTNSQEHLTRSHKVNWRFKETCSSSTRACVCSCWLLTPEWVDDWLCSCLCSSESLWWRSYAESESTAASSSSSLSWVQSSSTSSQTPSWRKQTSWRWPFASWHSCCSRTSSREDWWSTSTSCSLPLRRSWERLTSLLWAPQSTAASPKSRVRSAAPPGGRGRLLQTGVTSRQTGTSSVVRDDWKWILWNVRTCSSVWTETCICVLDVSWGKEATTSFKWRKKTSCHACCMNHIWLHQQFLSHLTVSVMYHHMVCYLLIYIDLCSENI